MTDRPSEILSDEEWAAMLTRVATALLPGKPNPVDDLLALKADRAALRARVAASDALLRQINVAHEAADRCQCEMFMDCQHASLQREAREALRAHLGAAP